MFMNLKKTMIFSIFSDIKEIHCSQFNPSHTKREGREGKGGEGGEVEPTPHVFRQ